MTAAIDHMLVTPTITMAAIRPRLRVAVEGRVLFVEVSPRDGTATLTARVTDGTGHIDCVFLGRRTIAGIEPGTSLRVEGVVTQLRDGPGIYNPRYELLPA